ncbi:hypothetical protein GGX14DRAFT_578400 [Mycena pura]|uniref:Uncharacterized protein n=1 Tax=Mycena pura TaxID=153505 RepID=A0AAD6USV4_9AGAR|nr:hypothetical protein GGX14DRAFT_578400 [Mycena pura]
MSSAPPTSYPPDATTTSTAAAPTGAHAHTQPATSAETQPPVDEHRKHGLGLGALVEKLAHPLHDREAAGKSADHAHGHTDTVSVPVAVPELPSDGPAHLAPGGSAVGGIK